MRNALHLSLLTVAERIITITRGGLGSFQFCLKLRYICLMNHNFHTSFTKASKLGLILSQSFDFEERLRGSALQFSLVSERRQNIYEVPSEFGRG